MLEQKKTISRWSGLNTENDPDDIKDEETPDSRNEDISEDGVDKTRNGLVKDNSSVLGGGLVEGILRLQTEDEIDLRIAITTDGAVNTF